MASLLVLLNSYLALWSQLRISYKLEKHHYKFRKRGLKLYTETGYITPTPPFDFAKSLHFLGHFAPMQHEQTLSAHTLTKAIYVEGQIVVFQISSAGSVEAPKLAYTLFS